MTDKPIKRIDIKEFRELGFLQEANRRFFHPLGLALEVVRHPDGTESLGGVWDERDDPEGIIFSDPVDVAKIDRVADERVRHFKNRILMMGSPIQPPGWVPR